MSENERLREVIERIQNAEMPLLDMAIAADDPAEQLHMRTEDVITLCRTTLAAKQETCVWRHNDYGYHTGCPQDVWLSSELLHIIGCYIEDDLNAIVYCPGCGREIEVKGE